MCPTYYILNSIGGHKGLFAIPPGQHAEDIPYYFTSQNPSFDNTQFIASFSGAFMDFVINNDVNEKISPDNITPFWDDFRISGTEMLFNVTSDGTTPVIQTIQTDSGLLQRCE